MIQSCNLKMLSGVEFLAPTTGTIRKILKFRNGTRKNYVSNG